MKRIIFLFLFVSTTAFGQKYAYKRSLTLMGSAFEITAISDQQELAEASIEAAIHEIQRIEKLISSWDPQSQTSEINRNAGKAPVVVDTELIELIRRSLKVSDLTEGAFDISFAAIDRIWSFGGQEVTMPSNKVVKNSVDKINYQNIIIDEIKSTVFLKEKGMKIGFGGIGKGYAANRAKSIMQEMGIEGGVVNASGDLISWGKQENGGDWRIGISDPKSPEEVLGWLVINNTAVVTSGDYEKFFSHEGKRYAHIIDPRTGYPTTGIKSVTIVCPDTELADALATSVFVLGPGEGMEMINALTGIEGLLITDANDIVTSDNLKLNFY